VASNIILQFNVPAHTTNALPIVPTSLKQFAVEVIYSDGNAVVAPASAIRIEM